MDIDFKNMSDAELRAFQEMVGREIVARRNVAEEKAWKNLMDALREYLCYNSITFENIIDYGDRAELYGMSEVEVGTMGTLCFKCADY